MTLFKVFSKLMLSPSQVVEEALKRKLLPPHNTPSYIKHHFSRLVEDIQIDAYHIYLAAQKTIGQKTIEKALSDKLPENAHRDAVIKEVLDMFEDLDRFYLSLTQSRRMRAGSAFEIILKTLFKNLDYPFDEQQVINGKPDFLMPSRKHYDKNPLDCIIFTAKRSLRERWRQIVTEGTRGLGFYLATIDEGISENQLQEMLNHRIYLVVPVGIKSKVQHYTDAPNVITYEEFFKHHLDPALARWKDKRVI